MAGRGQSERVDRSNASEDAEERRAAFWRRSGCQVNHRSFQSLAKCLLPDATWVSGEGAYASLAWCRRLTVELHPHLEAAESAKAIIDSSGCGGFCTEVHEVARLDQELHAARRLAT
jgi:hypothetical protein